MANQFLIHTEVKNRPLFHSRLISTLGEACCSLPEGCRIDWYVSGEVGVVGAFVKLAQIQLQGSAIRIVDAQPSLEDYSAVLFLADDAVVDPQLFGNLSELEKYPANAMAMPRMKLVTESISRNGALLTEPEEEFSYPLGMIEPSNLQVFITDCVWLKGSFVTELFNRSQNETRVWSTRELLAKFVIIASLRNELFSQPSSIVTVGVRPHVEAINLRTERPAGVDARVEFFNNLAFKLLQSEGNEQSDDLRAAIVCRCLVEAIPIADKSSESDPPKDNTIKTERRRILGIPITVAPKPPTPKKFPRPGIKRPKGTTINDLRKRLGQHEVVSFDIFETLLFRRLSEPKDLFSFLEMETVKLTSNCAALAQLRPVAEQEAREQSVAKGGGPEILLADVYQILGEWYQWDDALRDEIHRTEIELEDRFLFLNLDMELVYREARTLGMKVIALSDMYLPSDVLLGFLSKRGIEVDWLLVSGEQKNSKGDGKMFTTAIERLGVAADRILHIGDNAHSDAKMPKKLGMSCEHYLLNGERQHIFSELEKNGGECFGDAVASLSSGLARENRLHSNREEFPSRRHHNAYLIGYEFTGPLLFGFLDWLRAETGKSGIDHLHFFSRDGYDMIYIWEKMASQWGLATKASYFECSRRTLDLASITRLDDGELEHVCRIGPMVTMRAFIEKFGLKADKYAGVVANYGLPDLDSPILGQHYESLCKNWSDKLKKFVKKLKNPILKKSEECRRQLAQYLRQQDFQPDRSAFVDLGWAGSNLMSLQKAISSFGEQVSLRGYYLALTKDSQKVLNAGASIEGWYFADGSFSHDMRSESQPVTRDQVFSECIALVELLVSAPHGSASHFKDKDDGSVEMLHSSYEHDESEASILQSHREGLRKFADDLLKELPKPIENHCLDAYCAHVAKRFLAMPRKHEAEAFASFRHGEDPSGTISGGRTLAEVPKSLPSCLIKRQKALIHAYFSSFWPRGFRGQLQDTDLALLPDTLWPWK